MRNTTYNNAYITYDDEATWLVTYADLMTILLVFFVLLYSLAFFEKEEYKIRVQSVQVELESQEKLKGILDFLDLSDQPEPKVSLEDITGLRPRDSVLFDHVAKFIKQTDDAPQMSAMFKDGRIVVTMSGEALFSSGSADLNLDALPIFDRMIEIFTEFSEYTVNIKGHTDDVPIATQRFPSNWELSAIRATTVLQYLVAGGIDPDRLTATGYGEVVPRVPNTSDENRAKNRRVEFVLEKKETGR